MPLSLPNFASSDDRQDNKEEEMTNHPNVVTSTRTGADPRARRPLPRPADARIGLARSAGSPTRGLRIVLGVADVDHVGRDDEWIRFRLRQQLRQWQRDAASVPGCVGDHRDSQWDLDGGAESFERTDDGQLHPDHNLPPDRVGERVVGDRRLLHLGVRKADLRLVVDQRRLR